MRLCSDLAASWVPAGDQGMGLAAFSGQGISKELDQTAAKFCGSRHGVSIKEGKLSLASLFRQYASDFPAGPLAFFARFPPPAHVKEFLANHPNPKIVYHPPGEALNFRSGKKLK